MTETSTLSQGTVAETYTVQYDRLDDTPLSVAVAEAVGTATGIDITELDPLHYAIDADALERLFEPRANGLRTGGRVTFEFNDCLVTVSSDGEITVETIGEH